MDSQDTPENTKGSRNSKDLLKVRVLKIGENFGNYRVVKCLSAGLLVHYYQMQHVRDLRDVTVGIFHPRVGAEGMFLKRLESLQKTISTFDHDSFPKINDCSVVNDRVCVFFDPVEGKTLSEYFVENGQPRESGIEAKSVTRLAALLLGAMGYAHSQGVDHRDLDTDLIYVQEDGSIRILGLGFKAVLGIDLFESVVSASVSPLVSSQTFDRLNSFDVLSPEYKSGVAEDSRVDVFAIGVIAYWLLTARKPDFVGYESPTQLVVGLSPDWDEFVAQALHRFADQRYQSCKMALLGLQGLSGGSSPEGSNTVQRQIDRIPVPRRIADRGERASSIYRLVIIGVVGLVLTALAAYSLKVAFIEEEVYRGRDVARLAASEDRVSLSVSVKPSVVRVKFVGYDESFITRDGALALTVHPGSYSLKISAPHHVDEIVKFKLEPGASQTENLSVELKPAWTDIVIRTVPGASVSVVDKNGLDIELGVSNSDGVFSLKKGVFAGIYKVSIEKEGYESLHLEDQAFEYGTVAEIDADLTPYPATLEIQSQPSGALISIDEEEMGVTPLTLNEIAPTESLILVARLEGFRSTGRKLEVKPGATTVVDFGELSPLSGSLKLDFDFWAENAPEKSTLYDELEVLIDGKSMPFGDRSLDTVLSGEHVVQLVHPLYVSEKVTLFVEDKGSYELDFTLRPQPALVLLKTPEGIDVEIYVNKELVRVENGKIQVPANEEVEFEVRIRNHLTMTRSIQLAPNESFSWEVKPIPIPGPTAGQSWTLPYFNISFAWIPDGNFEMGSPLQEHARIPNEGPQTNVRFTRGFWVGIYEITQAQYSNIMEENPSQFKGAAKPVHGVTWGDAKVFCEMLTNFEREAGRLPQGYVYRLPTEPEWEYAARGGTTTPFSFGSEADATKGHFSGVYPRDRKDDLRAPVGYGTATVGRYQPNAYGLYDIHGNVREWTLDLFNGRLEGASLSDPKPRTEGTRIAVRGGGWEDSAARVRSAAREEVSPGTTSNVLGFRVVLAPVK